MGGLFTIIKVRGQLWSHDEDPGWYQHPPGTVALHVNDEELRRDGIDVNKVNNSDSEAVEKKPNEHIGH